MRWLPLVLALLCLPANGQSIPLEAAQYKRPFLKAVRQVWGLDAPAWLAAQVGQESGWRDGLTSSASARGLCQFIEGTASGIERQYAGLASWGRYSPAWCFYAQSLLMRDLFRDFAVGRNECDGIKFAGAGYNGSPSTLRREIALCVADHPNCDRRLWSENVATKRYRAVNYWQENRGYVFRITRNEPLYESDGWGRAYCKGR